MRLKKNQIISKIRFKNGLIVKFRDQEFIPGCIGVLKLHGKKKIKRKSQVNRAIREDSFGKYKP